MKTLQLTLMATTLSLLTACGGDNAKQDNAKDGGKQDTAQVTGKAPKHPECIAPAKPGGGFDLTCKLVQSGLQDTGLLTKPMRVTYLPGGIGAVAYNKIVANDRANGDAIVAFSTGSLLNLAQGKFGQFSEKDVKWLGAVGADYGAIAVRADSPYKNLTDLVNAIKANPKAVVFGSAGSVGSQDWVQTALLAKQANIDPKDISFVAMDGAEVFTALLGNHIGVVSGALAEMTPHATSGKLRILAVLAPERVEGSMKDVPTAKEQGFDIEWPVIRGYYMGPDVSAESYAWWKANFDKMLADPKFAEIRTQRELLPFAMTGDELTEYVYKETEKMRQLSKEFNLIESTDKAEQPKS